MNDVMKKFAGMRVPESIHKHFMFKHDLEAGKTYYGYGERAGFCFAKWDGKIFKVPHIEWGRECFNDYNHFQEDNGYACFFPITDKLCKNDTEN